MNFKIFLKNSLKMEQMTFRCLRNFPSFQENFPFRIEVLLIHVGSKPLSHSRTPSFQLDFTQKFEDSERWIILLTIL